MSDSGSGNQFGGEVIEDFKEVAKDVKDEVGQAIEQGVQSVVGKTPTPQQIQQQYLQRQKDQKELQRVRTWFKNLEQQTAQVREQNLQKEQQRLQNQQHEKQVSEIKKGEKKEQSVVNPALEFIGKPEKKGGVGG